MQEALTVLNEMEAAGIIGRYAIGGAIAAVFYVEPFLTRDLDIFFAVSDENEILTLSHIYQYLSVRGYWQHEGEAVVIGTWPVQFLPAFNPLIEEALAQARTVSYKDTPTRVFSAEHLVAIMLQTGRAKDYARIVEFLKRQAVNLPILEEVLKRHGLHDKWQQFLARQGSYNEGQN